VTPGSPRDGLRERVLHIGGYWRGPNDIVRQMMLGLREAGYPVHEYCTDEHREALDTGERPYDRGGGGPVWLRPEAVRPVVEAFAPDVIVCNAGGLGFRPDVAADLGRQRRLLGIALSDPDVFEPATRHIAPGFHGFLTNSAACVPRYRALGVRAARLPFATSATTFRPVAPRPEYASDVLVLGRALADRVKPARALCERFRVHLYGEDWEAHGLPGRGFVLGEDALAALSSARITVVFHGSQAGHPIIKPQLFDFLAAGALVATSEWPGLAEYFRPGVHLVGFRSTRDLLAKVEHYLARPDAARAIREAGRAHVLAHHTWARAWPRILAWLAGDDAALDAGGPVDRPGPARTLGRWFRGLTGRSALRP
jgi:hypothetical protein